MIYVLACPEFAPDAAARIDAFRAVHEPVRAALVPPHVTLVFGVGVGHLEDLAALAETVSRRTKPFQIEFDACEIAFDPFEKAHKLFALCGAGSETVTDLHRQLYDGPHRASLSPEHPFKPHMTLATQDMRARIERIDLSTLGALPIRAALKALTLVRLEGDRLETLKTVPFRG